MHYKFDQMKRSIAILLMLSFYFPARKPSAASVATDLICIATFSGSCGHIFGDSTGDTIRY